MSGIGLPYEGSSNSSSLARMIRAHSTVIALLLAIPVFAFSAILPAVFLKDFVYDSGLTINPISFLLATATWCFVHAVAVGSMPYTTCWRPASAVVFCPRRADGVTPLFYNSFIWWSMALDVVAWSYALTYVSEVDEILQAVTITANVPVLILIPYLLGAAGDPTSNIGSWLHYLKHEVREAMRAKAAHSGESHSLLTASDGYSTTTGFARSSEEKSGLAPFTYFVHARQQEPPSPI